MEKEIEFIPVDDLLFDPHNPRLPSSLRKKYNEGQVIEWMLVNENVVELMGSIGEEGFFPAEPLLIVPSLKFPGKWEVVEGNRRLTAVKLLNNPGLASKKSLSVKEAAEGTHKIDDLPTVKFSKRDDILSYLGYKHITGVQAWDSLAKAKYLKQLLESLETDESLSDKYKTLAKMIGSKSNYVRLLLVGAELFEIIEENDFFDIKNLEEESFDFGVFYTALGRKNIAKYVGVDYESEEPFAEIKAEHLKDVTKWIFEKTSEGVSRLGESRNIKHLDKILDPHYSKALNAFKDGRPLNESVRLTNEPTKIFTESIGKCLIFLETGRDYIHMIDSPLESHAQTLLEISKLSRDLCRLIQDKILNENEING